MTTWTNDDGDGSIHHHNYRLYRSADSGHKRRHLFLGPSTHIKSCCFCLFLLLVLLVLLAITVVIVFVLALKPLKPQFDLQQVSVQYILVAPTDAAVAGGSAYLELNVTLLFIAFNPNKFGIRYRRTAFDLMYRSVQIGAAAVAGFEQPADSRWMVETRVNVDRFNVLQSDAVINDSVELQITGDVGARFHVLGLTSAGVEAAVDCVIAISPRKQSLIHKQCVV